MDTDRGTTELTSTVAPGSPGPGTTGDGTHRRVPLVWSDRRLGFALAVAAGGAWGLLVGLWTPRGPLTSAQALWSIAVSLVVGALAGYAAGSRWAALAAPVSFAVVFELVRLDLLGPTVDRPALTMYGTLALVVGRGFHGLVSLAPLAFGAAFGASLAREHRTRTDPLHEGSPAARRWPAHIRRGATAIAAVGLVAFSAALARPASTAPIVDADGDPVPGSIAELSTVEVDGHDLHLMIRGHDDTNPVLLFLAGGPGGAERGAMRRHLPGLEEHFTVVTWDQRGSGASYDQLDPTDTLTLERAVQDTIAVTAALRKRFGQERIYLLGQSWGSTLGVLAVQRNPEMYRAFVGTGQMVSQLATDTIFYEDTLAWARAGGYDGLVAELVAIGEPPYARMLDYETALSEEHEVYPYDHGGNSEGAGGFSENLFVSEYALIDQVHALGAFVDTFSVLYPQLQDIDFRRDATEFDVPMFFVQGAHEAAGRAEVFDEWYPMIEAPTKDLVVLDTSGHRPLWEQPGEFVDYMVATVLARTRG